MPSGRWETDGKPSLRNLGSADVATSTMPFHIVVEGSCWLRMNGKETQLQTGDVVAFPFGTGHQLGVGNGGTVILPVRDLPPKPWREIPIMQYGDGKKPVRLICGYLKCDALSFRPLQSALPEMLHVRTRGNKSARWLGATIDQLVAEVDRPRIGGVSMLERLTEITFIEVLRHAVSSARPGTIGWIAALADPALSRCIALIHGDPDRAWSIAQFAAAAGVSRSTLAERFEATLSTSPMRYLRDWRLSLASVALGTTRKPISVIAHDAGYGTEAAFNRAFSRLYGVPPAKWRQTAAKA
jgi:AraC-like DNA-binding protein